MGLSHLTLYFSKFEGWTVLSLGTARLSSSSLSVVIVLVDIDDDDDEDEGEGEEEEDGSLVSWVAVTTTTAGKGDAL